MSIIEHAYNPSHHPASHAHRRTADMAPQFELGLWPEWRSWHGSRHLTHFVFAPRHLALSERLLSAPTRTFKKSKDCKHSIQFAKKAGTKITRFFNKSKDCNGSVQFKEEPTAGQPEAIIKPWAVFKIHRSKRNK